MTAPYSPAGEGIPPSSAPSKTPVIILSVVSGLLLLAILGVGGYILVKDEDSGGKGKEDASPSASVSAEPSDSGSSSSPSSDRGDRVIGADTGVYRFDVPDDFEKVDPPSSTYVEGKEPTYEHAVAPSAETNNPTVIIIVSVWNEGDVLKNLGGKEKKAVVEDIAKRLGHGDAELTEKRIDGEPAWSYSAKEGPGKNIPTINTFIVYDGYFVQIRAHAVSRQKAIAQGLDDVIKSFDFENN